MRTLSVLFLLVAFMASMASAELLTTANPIGQGKWAVLGAGIQDSNLSDMGNSVTLTTYGAYIGYGITDALDAFLQIGTATSTTFDVPNPVPPPTLLDGDVAATGYGLNLKYAVLSEKTMPVSLAIGAGYKSTSVKTKVSYSGSTISESTDTGTQMMLGVGVSKLIVPFIPYGALAYRTDSSEGSQVSTQIDLTVGTAIAWSTQGAIFLEYTNQSITPDGGDVYTSGQMAVGVGYHL